MRSIVSDSFHNRWPLAQSFIPRALVVVLWVAHQGWVWRRFCWSCLSRFRSRELLDEQEIGHYLPETHLSICFERAAEPTVYWTRELSFSLLRRRIAPYPAYSEHQRQMSNSYIAFLSLLCDDTSHSSQGRLALSMEIGYHLPDNPFEHLLSFGKPSREQGIFNSKGTENRALST